MHYDTSIAGPNGSTIRVRTQGRNLSGQLRKLCRDVRATGAVPTTQHFMVLPDRVLEFFIYEPDEDKQLKPVYEYRRASPIASQVKDQGQAKLGTAAFSCSRCRCYWGKNDVHCVPYPYGPEPLLNECPGFEGHVKEALTCPCA